MKLILLSVLFCIGGLATAGTPIQVAANSDHACAISSGGALYCWGNNEFGQLGCGLGMGYDVPEPTPVYGMTSGVTKVVVGNDFTCAIQSGSPYCWGYNYYGQLGNGCGPLNDCGYETDKEYPALVDGSPYATTTFVGNTTDIAAGYEHACVISSGTLYCWGYNGRGELGLNYTGVNFSLPYFVETKSNLIPSGTPLSIAAGDESTCAIMHTTSPAGNYMNCWGGSPNGGTYDIAWFPPSPLVFSTAGAAHTTVNVSSSAQEMCVSDLTIGAITSATSITSELAWTFGHNQYGDADKGTTTPYTTPVYWPGFGQIRQPPLSPPATSSLDIACTEESVVVSNETGTFATSAAGFNGNGQLGNNSTTNSSTAVTVSTAVHKMSGNGGNFCGIAGTNVYCWGENVTYGQIGDNTYTDRHVPTATIVPTGGW